MTSFSRQLVAVAALTALALGGCSAPGGNDAGIDAGPGACTPSSCSSGCCAGDFCVPLDSQSNAQCGSAGAACQACPGTDLCLGGVCTPNLSEDAGEPPPPNACTVDLDCRSFGAPYICVSGECKPEGRTCLTKEECPDTTEGATCNKEDGIGCFCDRVNPNDAGLGTCRQRLGLCDKCERDDECGGDDRIFWGTETRGPGICAQLPGDMSGNKYCRLYRPRCACGTVQDSRGFCYPQNLQCGGNIGCFNDSQCSASTVCSISLASEPDGGVCGGTCIPRCRWNFQTQTEEPTDVCKARGWSCWVDRASIDPNSPNFGSGRCRPPCTSDMNCSPAQNPFGDSSLLCRGEQLEGGGESAKRCRPNGCISNDECTEPLEGQPELGFCDRSNRACNYSNCRLGIDPVTKQAFGDCKPGFTCAQTAGEEYGKCRRVTCVEGNGANVACFAGQMCCGQDKNFDSVSDGCPAPALRDPDSNCYAAEAPWVCTTCATDRDCNARLPPSWHSCGNGANTPSCSRLSSRCILAPNVPPQSNPMNPMQSRQVGDPYIRVCAMATLNDQRFDPTPLLNNKAVHGCPAGYRVTYETTRVNPGMGADLCTNDSQCSVGTPDGGRCRPDPYGSRNQDGGPTYMCVCQTGSGRSECPNPANDAGYSECRVRVNPVPGVDDVCINTVTCVPPTSIVFRDAGFPDYGCSFRCDSPGAVCRDGRNPAQIPALCNTSTGRCQLN